MKKILRALLLPTVLALLSACAESLPYQEPLTGPRASVRFVSESGGTAELSACGDAACRTDQKPLMFLSTSNFFQKRTKRLGIPLWTYEDETAKEVYIDTSANPMFLKFSTSGYFTEYRYMENTTTSKSCDVLFNVAFETDKDYEVVLNRDPFTRCDVSVSELVERNASVTKHSLTTFEGSLFITKRVCVKVPPPYKKYDKRYKYRYEPPQEGCHYI